MHSIIPEKLSNALNIFETPKFMITRDASGEPNIALVMTWTVYDKNRLVYGDFMTYKSRMNLIDGNSKMALLVMTTDLNSWLIKSDFESYHKNDEIYEYIATTPLFKYNQYTNARGAGLAEARWISPEYSISKLNVLSGYLKAKLAARGVSYNETEEGNMPRPVMDRFSKMAAVKILSFIGEDGYPEAFPAFGIVPAHRNSLTVNRTEENRRGYHLSEGQRVAISLVTLEPAAFQVKGVFREVSSKSGIVEVDRVYACSLPRPGERIDIPLVKT
ncbi:MAG: hypothetical protein ACFFEF_16865 [Candidatus Thorarchaeota archaeon]